MFNHYILGFLAHDTVQPQQFVTRKPLDKTVILRLAEEMGQILQDGDISVDGQLFIFHADCLLCPAPVLRRKAADFIACLVHETGCDIGHSELGLFLTPENIRDECDLLSDPKNQPPPLW
jgi:hypothetical protein